MAFSISLMSGCINPKTAAPNIAPENVTLIDRITEEVESKYDPVPSRYLESLEFKQIRKKHHRGDFTNAVVHDVLGYDVEIVEHRFDESLVYAVSIRCTLPNDPIPEISHDNVEKIIYGYSIDDGLLIEDSIDIESIITSIKTQSREEHEETIFLRVGDAEDAIYLSSTWVHGCTLAIRMILKNGEEAATHGHVEDRDWNPVVADLFIEAMDEGHVVYLGGYSGSNLYPEAQVHGDLSYQIKGGEVSIFSCDTNVEAIVTIPSIIRNRPVTHIEKNAFSEGSKLIKIIIPDSVTNIIGSALDCTHLATISVASNNPVYSSFDGALLNRNGTDLLFVPSGKSGRYEIPNNVTRIKGDAFSYDSLVTNITITENVTEIEEHTFLDYPNLMDISVDETNPIFSSLSGVLFNKHQNMLIRYPSAKVGSYTIPDSVKHIGKWAFYDCAGLTSVTIPDQVTHIEDWAFDSCSKLSEISFLGNAPCLPSDDKYVFPESVIIYYSSGKTGWEDTFGGRPTILRNP